MSIGTMMTAWADRLARWLDHDFADPGTPIPDDHVVRLVPRMPGPITSAELIAQLDRPEVRAAIRVPPGVRDRFGPKPADVIRDSLAFLAAQRETQGRPADADRYEGAHPLGDDRHETEREKVRRQLREAAALTLGEELAAKLLRSEADVQAEECAALVHRCPCCGGLLDPAVHVRR